MINRRAFSTAVLGLVIVSSLLACKQFSPNKNDVKLKEVEGLWASFPVYPGFQESGGSTYSKSMLAAVNKYYKSDAGYDEVKTFYATQLGSAGWQQTKERNMKDWSRDLGGRELTFGKGEYSVVIEYWGDKAIDPDWNYAINVRWDDK